MRRVILSVFLFLTSCTIQNDKKLEVIVSLDGDSISGGWTNLEVKTLWNSKLVLSYDENLKQMNDIKIKSNNHKIVVDYKLLTNIQTPDFGTLNDIWFSERTKKIDSFNFEFFNLFENYKNNYGRYLVEFVFLNYEIYQINISKFDEKTNDWLFLFDKLSETMKL